MSIPFKHTIKSYDDYADTCELEIQMNDREVEINMPGDVGKIMNGAAVDDGYCRTVRIEVRENVLKVLIYPVQCDEPMIVEVAFNDCSPRVVE